MKLDNWSALSPQQFGHCGEVFAKLVFAVNGFDIYAPEVDDHGVDFVAMKNGIAYEVQVKAVRNGSYTFIKKDKTALDDKHLLCYARFTDGRMPEIYVFSTKEVFAKPVLPFSFKKKYKRPEYGISGAAKHAKALAQFAADAVLETL